MLRGLFARRGVTEERTPIMQATGNYQRVWENKPQPDPGAMSYAWETLQLAYVGIIGAGMGIRQQIKATAPASYALQTAPLTGIGLVTGQMIMQPLYDPNSMSPTGYSRDLY